ncbi:MAG: DEAD/DEAH box helicase family protein [Candidatus Thermoplasmatota archaeon]|nr:DEAD/DEAH box helicase family protein [Candidatus Thermoplasmatota archaeon]
MKLLSHGAGSCLLQHLREVSGAAQNLEEKVICCCHDIGKATTAWQNYIRSGSAVYPHHHAASGGLLASLLIKCMDRENVAFHALVALHSGAAHHSLLALCTHNRDEFCIVAADSQVKDFFLDEVEGVKSLLPEINRRIFETAWDEFTVLASLPQDQINACNQWLTGSGEMRLQAFLAARSLLGRMCYLDHRSAAVQSGSRRVLTDWQQAYPDRRFLARTPRNYPDSGRTLHRLRKELKTAFHSCLESTDTPFYFIDAPTGLGKTETMLSGAELLQDKYTLNRIVFAVPQISIADQIFAEYFNERDHAQIWNFLRQEKKASPGECESNTAPGFTLDLAAQPFSESYNITTFNQVLLAMCHPHRMRCIRSLGLKNAVIIMDEFHKLPMSILPYFFRIATEYAHRHNCRFIFGSATPLEEFEYLGLAGSGRMPKTLTATLYSSPAVDDRRRYRYLGALAIDGLIDAIDAFQAGSQQNLLVVLNLVSEGTWPLFKHYSGTYNPWRQLALLEQEESSRAIVFLDGLVPPLLRRQLVTACKKAMRRRPVTLISTQMVEVGVDLDFDHALVDYQGLAATIQRGGRVGREGREYPCTVEIFSLLTSSGDTSFARLCEVQLKNDFRLNDGKFRDIAQKTERFWQRETRFLEKLTAGQLLKDSELTAALLTVQERIFGKNEAPDLLADFFPEAMGYGELGVDLLAGQYIAELFSGEYGSDLLLLEDEAMLEQLNAMLEQLADAAKDDTVFKRLNRFIADRTINVTDRIKTELGLIPAGQIELRDNLPCMLLAPPIL